MKKIYTLGLVAILLSLYACGGGEEKTDQTVTQKEDNTEATQKEAASQNNEAAENSSNSVEITLEGETFAASEQVITRVRVLKETAASEGAIAFQAEEESKYSLRIDLDKITTEQAQQVPLQITKESVLEDKGAENVQFRLVLTDFTQKPAVKHELSDGEVVIEKFSEKEVVVRFSGRVGANKSDVVRKENLQAIS
ncbi:MAG: hypothetical protein AAF734_13005, partial [Bacteroidota bacterium]